MTATPASHPFEIREHDEGPVHVIAMRGELDLATAPRLCVRIDAARRAGSRRILIDLTTAGFCDSAGLRALIGTYRELAAHGRRMAVAALEDSAVGRLFALAGANELLEIHQELRRRPGGAYAERGLNTVAGAMPTEVSPRCSSRTASATAASSEIAPKDTWSDSTPFSVQ